MKRILVFVEQGQDPSAAISKAVSMAKATSAGIHVVANCYQALDFFDDQDSAKNATVKSSVISEQERWWSENAAALADGLDMTHEVVWEKHIISWLLNHCQNETYDLVVKGVEKEEIDSFSPTDWALFRESNVPVYTVMPQKINKSSTILVSLDLLTKRKEKQELNAKLLEAGFRIAVATNQELHCCSVINVPGIITELDPAGADLKRERLKSEALANGKELFERYDLDAAHIHIEAGVPWKRIASQANNLKSSCIVLGTMGRKGIAGKLFGNTSEKIIRVARNDLLVINP